MTYSLTLVTDEYTLTGEVYERDEPSDSIAGAKREKGYEYRLYYTDHERQRKHWEDRDSYDKPTLIWDSDQGEMKEEYAKHEVMESIRFPERTIFRLFSTDGD